MKHFLTPSFAVVIAACSSSETHSASAVKDAAATDGNGQDARSTGSGGSNGGSGGSGNAGGAEAGVAPCVPGGTWTIVDDYVESGAKSMNPDSMLVTPNGTVYTTGMVQRTGMVSGLIRQSTDGSTFTNLPAAANLGGDVAVLPDGTMFSIGATGTARVIQRSRDAGQSWSEVDPFPLAAGSPCNTGYLDVDSKGTLFAAGSCDTEGWIVRKSENGGDTWSDVERFFRLAPGNPARLIGLAIDAGDRVFVSGNTVDAAAVTHWIVRRLTGTGTFTTVDDLAGGDTPSVSASTAHVHAAGMANTSAGPHWIVRRADASGGTWTTIDDFTYPNATRVIARGLYEGPNGALIALGSVTDAAGVDRVVTRRSTDDGKTWSVTDEWTYSPGKSSGAGPIAADRRGNVYGLFRGVASDDVSHWIVRKLDCARP